jgi:transposase
MEKEDARKQSREVLHERRKQVIRMHRKGMPVMQIVEHSGLSWHAVNAAITCYSTVGAAALKPAARGKKQGSGRMLSESQEIAVRQIICDKRPEQLKMEFALWNRAAVMQLIERECAITLSVRGVGNYLKRWGFTPQMPTKKAYEQRPEAVQAWLDNEYPAIKQRAKSEGAEIHWGFDPAVVNTDVRGRCYAPAGKRR